jgi:hypothetical protein
MATFIAYYSTGDYGKVWFDADSLEEARDLIDQVLDGNTFMNMEDLPNVGIKLKGNELEIDGLVEVNS